jgi:superfamily II DNA or RNA helicase
MKPFAHQESEFNNHWSTKARALLWPPRSGKTKSAIDMACALYQVCAIEGVIVIAPNGVHRNWTIKELPKHHWAEVPYQSYAWRSIEKKKLEKVAALVAFPGLVWITFNMEAFGLDEARTAIVKLFIRSRPNFLLIVDESHHFAQPGTKRTKWLRGLSHKARYRRILTGTPVEEAPLQAYSQYQIVQEGCLGFTLYEDFKERYAEYEKGYSHGRNYPVLKEYKNLEDLKARIAPFSSVVLPEECHIPPLEFDPQVVELSEKAERLYDALRDEDIDTLLALGFVEPPAGGALLWKLQQIEGGYLITPDGVKILDGASTKFNIVLDEIKRGTAIVFCNYVHEVEETAKKLNALGIPTGIAHGQAKNREGTLQAFQAGKLQALVAQCRSVSEGYEINAAEKIIWYSQTPSAIVRTQANQRATKIGTEKKNVIDLIWPGGADEYFLSLTNDKTELADDIARRGLQTVIQSLGRNNKIMDWWT